MIEYFDTLITLGGVLLGFILGRRERNLKRPTTYRCECQHSLAMHKDTARKDKSLDTRCMKGNCVCQQYVGPRPVIWEEGDA